MAEHQITIKDGEDVVITSGTTKITIKTDSESVKEDVGTADKLLLG
jgi:hypothetical protein